MVRFHRRERLGPARLGPVVKGAGWPSSVTARVSTAASTLMVGRGLSRTAIATAAT